MTAAGYYKCLQVFALGADSFIHYEDLYSAPSRLLLRSAPDPCTAKEKSFEARECANQMKTTRRHCKSDEYYNIASRWLAPLCGMGFLCRKGCSPGFFLTHFTLASKLLSLAVQESGALLSSNLEGALYKSP